MIKFEGEIEDGIERLSEFAERLLLLRCFGFVGIPRLLCGDVFSITTKTVLTYFIGLAQLFTALSLNFGMKTRIHIINSLKV